MAASYIQYVMEGLSGVIAGTLITMNIWERFINIKVIFRTWTYLPMMNVSFIIKLVRNCARYFCVVM